MCRDTLSIIENVEKRQQIKIARNKESRKMNGRQKSLIQTREIGLDRYYDPQSKKPDLSLDAFEILK